MRPSFLALLLSCSLLVNGQSRLKSERIFQFSLTPALGTNGLHPAGYRNYFSLNITSGYSAANYLFEIAGISNLNVQETRGLQFAGIANITGGNAYAGMQFKEIEKKTREGFEANLSGLQVSGLANVVINNVFGAQITGGVNIAKGALQGLQIAGISNTVYKYSFAVQLAGLYNVSAQSMDGVQVAGFFNITKGGLFGLQLAMINLSDYSNGINSFEDQYPTGVQLGLVNISRKMNGFQIGLVNYSKRMQGTQIGLINFYRGGKDPETRDGTSIGLLNFGSTGYLGVYSSDLFPTNIEIATGTNKNRRVMEGTEKQIQNSLIYSNDAKFLSNRTLWAFGYGIKKVYFNRSATPGMGRFHFVSVGIDWMHVNHQRKKITKELSLLARPGIMAGTRFHPKNRNFFFFASANYNFYKSKSGKKIDMLFDGGDSSLQHSPGFSAGVFVQ
jgi:hypothetical protein